jgi:hypothetical protein
MTLTAPVFYDDLSHIQNAPLLGKSWGEVWAAVLGRRYFELASERTYQPLVTLLHHLTGARPLLYRGLGLAVHALNAFVVWRLARRLTGARAAWLAALLFCAFPASTETVFFASFHGHLLACAGTLLALEAWLDYLADRGQRPLARSLLWLTLALCAKETGVTAAALCGLAWLLRGRPRRSIPGLAALAGLCGLYLAWRFLALNPPPAFPGTFARPTLDSLAWYARALVWPWPLCLERQLPASPALGALVLAGLAAAGWAWRRKAGRLFLLAWLPLALLPFLHLIAFANLSPVADRYLYLAAAGWCLLLADVGASRGGEAALALLLTVWGGMTAARNGLFRDERGFFEQTAQCAPDHPRAHYLCGLARLKDGDPRGAAVAFLRAHTLWPSDGSRQLVEKALREANRSCSSSDCK